MRNFYIVDHHSEECHCAWCGQVIYVGERVFLTCDDEPTCGTYCATHYERDMPGPVSKRELAQYGPLY